MLNSKSEFEFLCMLLLRVLSPLFKHLYGRQVQKYPLPTRTALPIEQGSAKERVFLFFVEILVLNNLPKFTDHIFKPGEGDLRLETFKCRKKKDGRPSCPS